MNWIIRAGKISAFAVGAFSGTMALAGEPPVKPNAVALYVFDQVEVGASATSSTVIENLSDPGTIQGHVRNNSGAPVGVGSPAPGLMLYDPMTGKTYSDDRSMKCQGSSIDIAADAKLALTNVTVEVVFRVSANASASAVVGLVDKRGTDDFKDNWSLMINNGSLWSRHCRESDYGKNWGVQEITSPGKVSFGVWHHAAFTYDSTGTGRLYLDYALQCEGAAHGEGLYPSQATVAIAARNRTDLSSGTFDGDIAAVRILDGAIGVDDFIRIKAEPVETDPDTLVYVRNDTPWFDAGSVAAGLVDLNSCTNVKAHRVEYFTGTGDVMHEKSDSVVSAQIWQNKYARQAEENGGSLLSLTNAFREGTAFRVYDPDGSVSSGSFTAEMFVRAQQRVTTCAGMSLTSWALMWAPSHKLYISDQNIGNLALRAYTNKWGDYNPPGDLNSGATEVDDGSWHHVAVVFDAVTEDAAVYLDRKLVAQGSRKHYEGGESTQGGSYFYFNYCKQGDVVQYFSGWTDSFRITGRALSSREFLSKRASEGMALLFR